MSRFRILCACVANFTLLAAIIASKFRHTIRRSTTGALLELSWLAMEKIRKIGRGLFDKALAEDGTATVEAILWIPVYALILTLIADVSMVFHNQAQVMRIIQDGNRQLSVGRLKTSAQAEDYITAALAGFSDNAQVSTNLSSTGVINTSVLVPTSDLDSVGSWARLADINLVVSAQHLIEF